MRGTGRLCEVLIRSHSGEEGMFVIPMLNGLAGECKNPTSYYDPPSYWSLLLIPGRGARTVLVFIQSESTVCMRIRLI